MPAAYKVVKRRRNGSRVSVLIESKHPAYQVYMRNGKVQEVNHGMVFASLSDARRWKFTELGQHSFISENLKSGETLEIWECEYKFKNQEYMIDVSTFIWTDIFQGLSKKSFKQKDYCDILSYILKKHPAIEEVDLIPGAMSVSKVRLIRKISQKEQNYGC